MSRSEDRAITQAHDKLVKRILSNPAHAAKELQAILPPGLVVQIDWDSLVLENTTSIDHELEARYSDLVFTARIDGRGSIIYVLFEHQSTADPFITLRMLGYLVRTWEQVRDQQRELKRLPPIVPVLLQHTRSGRESVPIIFSELLDIDPADVDSLRPYLPDFQLVLEDLDRLSIEELKARKLPALVELLLALLKLSRTKGSLLEKLEQFVETLRKADDGTLGIATLISYILEVRDEPPNEVRQFFHEALGPSGLEAFVTGAEMLVAEERAKALEQGARASKAADVIAVLEARGLDVSDEQRQLITNTSDLELLDKWVRRAATISSTDELFVD